MLALSWSRSVMVSIFLIGHASSILRWLLQQMKLRIGYCEIVMNSKMNLLELRVISWVNEAKTWHLGQ